MTATELTMAARGFALWREAMRWQRNLDASLIPLQLTHTQYLVLFAADGATTKRATRSPGARLRSVPDWTR